MSNQIVTIMNFPPSLQNSMCKYYFNSETRWRQHHPVGVLFSSREEAEKARVVGRME